MTLLDTASREGKRGEKKEGVGFRFLLWQCTVKKWLEDYVEDGGGAGDQGGKG